MRLAIVLALALVVGATAASAVTNGRDGSGGYGPFGDGYANLRSESDVLVYQDREANAGFGDLIPLYSAALTLAGATVSQVDAPSGVTAFPADYTPDNYCVTFILTGENWWGPCGNGDPGGNFTPAEEAAVTAYMNGGGNVYFSGQDYLYGACYGDGAVGGFPNAIGAGSIVNDTPFGADFMDVLGHDLFDGWFLSLDSFAIFLANPFYPDTINPRAGAAVLWEQLAPEVHPGAVIYDAGTYRSIFSALELAGDATGQFNDVIAGSWGWLKAGCGPTATQPTSWGGLKATYR
jgi:hypothetical protein